MTRQDSKTITLAQPAAIVDEPVPELLGRRKRPEVGQFRLLVDRQTKASFATYEAAEKAAIAIKTGHPIVNVVVYDAKDGENHVMELAKKYLLPRGMQCLFTRARPRITHPLFVP